MKSSELDEGYKEMYLTNSDDMGRISQTDPDAVYVLNEKPKEIMENICYFNWQEPETYVSILNALFPEEPYMGELLYCFLKHNMWRNSWFYHELPHTLSGFIAKTILEDCKNLIEQLESLKPFSSDFQWHRDFMILYCRYLGMGISWDYDSLEFIKNQSLLKDCKDMEKSYGKSLSLWLMTAKISYLSPITRPNVLNYLRMIQKLDGTANICYLIGLQCDVTYGNYKLAKSFWLKGYQVDPNFIPTCYLKATILQQNNKYFEAVVVRPGQVYRHFKGNIVKVLQVAQDSESPGQYFVIYECGDSKAVWCRPYGMFLSEVDHKKYPNITQKYRFELVEE